MHIPPSSRRFLLPACVLGTLALAVPGAAQAATISGAGGTYTYTGAPGETNNVSLQGTDDGHFVFYGNVAVTSAPAGCTPSDMYGWEVVTCPMPSAVSLQAGDGDENITVSPSIPAAVAVTIDGGAGRDWISGDHGNDTLLGGPGNDKLAGNAGNDTLDGGDGDDELIGAAGADHLLGGAGNDNLAPDAHEAPSPDVVDGGPGVDTIDGDYSSRFAASGAPNPLSFTLGGGADDGRSGEGDDITGVERLQVSSGGRFVGSDGPEYIKLHQVGSDGELIGNGGDDELLGGDGADRLDGGAGNDKLDGGFGDDTIVGGPGRDTISGDRAGGDCGPIWCKLPYGNDIIDARDGEIDSISCGAGTDTVLADANDVVAPDCESIARSGAPAPATPTTPTGPAQPRGQASKPGAAGLRLTPVGRVKLAAALRHGLTVRVAGARTGTLKLQALSGRTVVARGSVRVTARGTATVRLRFTHTARRTLGHARRVTLTITGGGTQAKVTLRRR